MTRVIIITGAGSGIGQGTALTFAERGDVVVAADIDLTAAQRTLAGTTQPSAHMAVRCDVSDEASVQQMVAGVLARYGRIDVLVNNAGILISKPLHLTSWPEWQRILNTNLGSVYLCSAAVLPTMLSQQAGAIINICHDHEHCRICRLQRRGRCIDAADGDGLRPIGHSHQLCGSGRNRYGDAPERYRPRRWRRSQSGWLGTGPADRPCRSASRYRPRHPLVSRTRCSICARCRHPRRRRDVGAVNTRHRLKNTPGYVTVPGSGYPIR